MEVSALIAEARSRAGLHDLGDTYFLEALERLVASVNRETRFSAFGAVAFRETLISALVNRLEIESWYARHPEIDDEEIVAPLFGVGLPRTGSTLLGFLLSLDPASRSIRYWESLRPCPPPVAGDDKDPRIAAAEASHDAFIAACPSVLAMAPYKVDGPVECFEFIALSFDFRYNITSHCPTFMEWVYHPSRDHTPTYRYHKRVLKLLQWQCPPKRWSLKSPIHSYTIDDLYKVYPDARFVMTHRDPLKVIPSAAIMDAALRTSFLEDPMNHYVGEQQLNLWGMGVDRVMAFRKDREHLFHDIHHADLLRDSEKAVAALYDWLGWNFSDTMRQQIRQWRNDNPQGVNKPDLAPFGITDDDIRTRFAAYRQRFMPGAT